MIIQLPENRYRCDTCDSQWKQAPSDPTPTSCPNAHCETNRTAKTLNEALDKLLSRFKRGEYGHYTTARRAKDPQRWDWFKDLIQRRGERYAPETLDTFICEGRGEKEIVVSAVKQYADRMPDELRDGGSVILLGPVGNGKDHLLFGLMRDAIIRWGFEVIWWDGLALFSELKQLLKEGYNHQAFITKLKTVQILAISDPIPPRDQLTTFEMNVLREIIEYRYSHVLSTWITTNVDSAKEAEELFSAAILSRLLHNARQFFLPWESYRKPKGT